MSEPNKGLIITVKAARINADKSQEDAANSLGISITAYKRKENGLSRFYVDEIAVLSRLFKVNMTNFFEAQCHKKTRKELG
ncbi:hypothetical protein SDC9_192531 [bioreactor metagenome]|uniref:HTH cro/C1-type domain-containing protein n=1 Tax=bioreactor metagenome TaxID=1076179 RepID=A0A645I9H4_9ZZZZ